MCLVAAHGPEDLTAFCPIRFAGVAMCVSNGSFIMLFLPSCIRDAHIRVQTI